jgi:hypothetical protein
VRLRNTSRYPTEEVRRLVELGMRGVRTERLAVHVKNSTHRGSGRAYSEVPSVSPRAGQSTVDRLVALHVGPPDAFPTDNMQQASTRFQIVPMAEYEAMPDVERTKLRHVHGSDGHFHAERQITVPAHPYGGKRSPLIICNDWREWLVSVAAHEARHIWQFQNGKPRSEVECERFAAKALARFRTVPA